MFKSARWRSEKKKFKAVFKLHFQATQVPQLKKAALTISLVPEDVGKPTVRLEKAPVRDGTCSWDNPIYETVKFTRESKTGKINEKIYYFIVSSGSSKAGFLGEVLVDFAEYAEATIPSTVSLPLTSSDSGTLLHVTIQKMQGADCQREPCKAEDASPQVNHQDRSMKDKTSNFNTDINDNNDTATENGYFSKTTSETAEPYVSLSLPSSTSPELATRPQNGTFRESSSSTSALTSKLDVSSRQSDASIPQDPNRLVAPLRQHSMPKKSTMDGITQNYHAHRRSSIDWSTGSASDGSIADSITSPDDNFTSGGLPETFNGSIERVKSETFMLMRQTEVMELELQSLRKQVVKETKRGQDLSRKIISLREERDAFREECQQLKLLQETTHVKEVSNKLEYKSVDSGLRLEEIRKELNYEKDLNTNLQSQLHRIQDSNTQLIFAVRDLEEMMEHKNEEISYLSSKIETNSSIEGVKEILSNGKTNKDEDQTALEELVKEHNDVMEVDLLKHKITELTGERVFYKKDKEYLETHIEQLVLDNESLEKEKNGMSSKFEQSQRLQADMQNEYSSSLATVDELKSHIETLEMETKKQTDEFLAGLGKNKELESQMRNLEKELEKQAEEFKQDLEAMTRAKVEQEQRTIQAEEALRKTRQKNAVAAERLQEEFRKLSVEMAAKFDENEKLAMNAVAEANELRFQRSILEEKLHKAIEELLIKDQYRERIQELSSQLDLKSREVEKISLELDNKSKQLEDVRTQGEEKYKAVTMEMQMLRTEIERLKMGKDDISKKAEQKERTETEEMTKSTAATEMQIQRWNTERDELEKKFALAKNEAKKLQEELTSMRCIKDENETIIGPLLSEIQSLKEHCNKLKHSMIEEELEKEKMRKQIAQLKSNLQKKVETIIATEKTEEISGQGTIPDVVTTCSRNNKSALLLQDSEDILSLKEEIEMLQEEMKLKEAALENSDKSSTQKEKDLNAKIEELKRCTKKVHMHSDSEMNATTGMLVQNRVEEALAIRQIESCSEKEHQASTFHISEECDLTKLLTEVAELKERNKSMEGELKDMQERYSEISLKFAEVEGERQQLVMTVRNLKNSKKN